MTIVEAEVVNIPGPILILGASGFIGANLFQQLLSFRPDVYGNSRKKDPWRLREVDSKNIIFGDLCDEAFLDEMLKKLSPMTVINCATYGAYPFQNNIQRIYQLNLTVPTILVEKLKRGTIHCYLHCGSSSEYGTNAFRPAETDHPEPNSYYSASKLAFSHTLQFLGKHQGFPCANLRLYSVYGPLEEPTRLIPTLIKNGLNKQLPTFVSPTTSRDFIHIDDVIRSIITIANKFQKSHYGESFNIGTGVQTTISQVAKTAVKLFSIEDIKPEYSMKNRDWDVERWCANTDKINNVFNFTAKISFEEGLQKTVNAYKSSKTQVKSAKEALLENTPLDTTFSVSAIVACYKDELAIPIMHAELTKTFLAAGIDYEIIFVNDCSPDNDEEAIRLLSEQDLKVIGISHSRNFGSQAAFKSGMEIATKNSCVLLDGDLQDPPEVITSFIKKWKQGFDVVYGRRVKREAVWYMQISFKLFYRLFDYFSYIKIPHDAGDFALLDRKVMQWIIQCPERDLFLRGLRAYVGFKQCGVDYFRPERRFGKSTNNIFKYFNWAKQGILSFSKTPLNILTTISIIQFIITILMIATQIILKVTFPDIAPEGITTIMLLTMIFGSTTLLAISMIGEYIAKIFDEVKQRPHYIRRHIIRHGDLIDAHEEEDKGIK